METKLPLKIKGNIVGYSAADVCETGIDFYGVRGLFTPAVITRGFGYKDIADIELEVNRFAADNVTIHFKDPRRLPFMFQTYKDAGPMIVDTVKALLAAQKEG